MAAARGGARRTSAVSSCGQAATRSHVHVTLSAASGLVEVTILRSFVRSARARTMANGALSSAYQERCTVRFRGVRSP